MNHRGEKPESLLREGDEKPGAKGRPIDLASQDDLTRFDKAKKKNARRSPRPQPMLPLLNPLSSLIRPRLRNPRSSVSLRRFSRRNRSLPKLRLPSRDRMLPANASHVRKTNRKSHSSPTTADGMPRQTTLLSSHASQRNSRRSSPSLSSSLIRASAPTASRRLFVRIMTQRNNALATVLHSIVTCHPLPHCV